MSRGAHQWARIVCGCCTGAETHNSAANKNSMSTKQSIAIIGIDFGKRARTRVEWKRRRAQRWPPRWVAGLHRKAKHKRKIDIAPFWSVILGLSLPHITSHHPGQCGWLNQGQLLATGYWLATVATTSVVHYFLYC